jgi:hypothetical protein
MSPDHRINRNFCNYKMPVPAFRLVFEYCLFLVLVTFRLVYIWPSNKNVTMFPSSETLAQTNRKYWE